MVVIVVALEEVSEVPIEGLMVLEEVASDTKAGVVLAEEVGMEGRPLPVIMVLPLPMHLLDLVVEVAMVVGIAGPLSMAMVVSHPGVTITMTDLHIVVE